MSFERIPLSGSVRLALEVFDEIQDSLKTMIDHVVWEFEVKDCRAQKIYYPSEWPDESWRSIEFFLRPPRNDIKKLVVTLYLASRPEYRAGRWTKYGWRCTLVKVLQVNADGSRSVKEIR